MEVLDTNGRQCNSSMEDTSRKGLTMLSPEDNERLCRIGPGTSMGNVFRRYWLPVCVSTQIARPDSDPLRVSLLGERLVAFRDSEGKVGVLDELCSHRGA